MNTYLVSYDITVDNKREKVAAKLIYFGFERIQFSVFMGRIKKTLINSLVKEIQPLIGKDDKFLVVPLPPATINNYIAYGKEKEFIKEILREKHTLYFG